MKRLRLKKWVINVVVVVSLFLSILLGAECENTTIFILSKIVIMFTLFINYKILYHFTDFVDKEFQCFGQ